MTTARQTPKPSLGQACGLVVSLALAILGLAGNAEALPGRPVVTDPQTGIAISGFDPVAYFTEAAPGRGQPELELNVNGIVWRFRNEGNRAAFADNPEVYAPQFGGYDPIDLARGVTVAANPRFWLISAQRLYLFSREENRDAFAADPSRFAREANLRWPELWHNLAQ